MYISGVMHHVGSSEPRQAYIDAYEKALSATRFTSTTPVEWRPFFLFWLEELRADAAAKEMQTETVYRRAIKSLEQHKGPLPNVRAAKEVKVISYYTLSSLE
jgi:hypothetical protein